MVALGRMGDSRAAPALVACCSTTTSATSGCRSAARSRGSATAAPSRRCSRSSATPTPPCGRRRSARSTRSAIPRWAPASPSMLDDPSPLVRESAVRIAGYFGYAECADGALARCQRPGRDGSCRGARASPVLRQPARDRRVGGGARQRHAAGPGRGRPGPRIDARRRRAAASRAGARGCRAVGALLCGHRPRPAGRSRRRSMCSARWRDRIRPFTCRSRRSKRSPRSAATRPSGCSRRSRERTAIADRRRFAVLGRVRSDRAVERAPRRAALRRLAAASGRRRGPGDPGVAGGRGGLAWTAAADADPQVAGRPSSRARSRRRTSVSRCSRLAVEALVETLRDPSRRAEALDALARLAPSAIPHLANALGTSDPVVRRGVVEALGRLAHSAASAVPAARACPTRTRSFGGRPSPRWRASARAVWARGCRRSRTPIPPRRFDRPPPPRSTAATRTIAARDE